MVESLIKSEKMESKVLLKIVFVVIVFVSWVKANDNNNCPTCKVETCPATPSTSLLPPEVPNPYAGIDPYIIPVDNPIVVEIVDHSLSIFLGSHHCFLNINTQVDAATVMYGSSANIAADRYEIYFKMHFNDNATGESMVQEINLLADYDYEGNIQIINMINTLPLEAAGIHQ